MATGSILLPYVLSSGGIFSISGTANEIIASPSTGDVILSLSTALTFTGKTITGGTFAGPTLQTPALGTPASGILTNCTGLPTTGLLDAAVTYAKIQNVSATDKVLGRITAGAGVVEEIATTGSGNVVRANSPTISGPTLTDIPIANTLYGGVAANDDIHIRGTSHATKTTSYVYLNEDGGGTASGRTPLQYVLHAFGGSLTASFGLASILDSGTGAILTAAANGDILAQFSGGGTTFAKSTFNPTLACGFYLDPSGFGTSGSGTIANSAGLYIAAASTIATNNYSIFIDAGLPRIDSPTSAGTGVGTITNVPNAGGGNPAIFLLLNINGTSYAFPGWSL